MPNSFREKTFYRMLNASLNRNDIIQLRRELLSTAAGDVLEIGFGSGLNLPFYPEGIRSITAIDPCLVEPSPVSKDIPLRIIKMSAEKMLFPDENFDTVVSTYTLCSIPNPQHALQEVARVLKPEGKFLFLEHGRHPNRVIACIQNMVNPFYRIFAFGCNVNRDMPYLITGSGMRIVEIRRNPTRDPIGGFYFIGTAKKIGVSC